MDVKYSTSARNTFLDMLSDDSFGDDIEKAIERSEGRMQQLKALKSLAEYLISDLESEMSGFINQWEAMQKELSDTESRLKSTPRTATLYDTPNSLRNNENPRIVRINENEIAALENSINAQKQAISITDARIEYIDTILNSVSGTALSPIYPLKSMPFELQSMISEVSNAIDEMKRYQKYLKQDLREYKSRVSNAAAPIEDYLDTRIGEVANTIYVNPVNVKGGY